MGELRQRLATPSTVLREANGSSLRRVSSFRLGVMLALSSRYRLCGTRGWLQVTDAATDLAVPRVAGGLPERRGYLVLIPDEGGDPASALAAQVLLAGLHKRQADPPATMLVANGKPIHVAPPAVPRGDQRAEDRTIGVGGDEQAPGRRQGQSLHILEPVGGGRVLTASLLP
jgi:hypothetical protein